MDVSGIVVVNKHAGVTSNDIVIKLRRLFGTRQVGHTGTLDPMATGVLPVLIGRAVKASENITAENKRYTAHLKLGITTDTEDTTGTVLSKTEHIPSDGDVLHVCSTFVAEILQTPPMYSALKVNGRKLVDLAREGIVVVNKHAGVTSNDIVIKLRRLFGTRQVGHTGTLDPMATGGLPVLIGRAVKASENITAENKRYTAHLKLGITTDTEDTPVRF